MLSLPAVKKARLSGPLALLLVLVCTALITYLFRNGAPPRIQFSALMAALLVTPVLLRWQHGWLLLFLFAPLVTGLRRLYLLFDPSLHTYSFDLMTVLPDGILLTMGLGLFLSRRSRRALATPVDDKWLKLPIAFLIAYCVIQIFNPDMGSWMSGLNGFRQFTLYMFLYFITQQVLERKEQVYQWLTATVLLGAVTGLYGAYQYIVEFPEWDRMWANAFGAKDQIVGESMRAFSSFSFTSTFSHYMVIACAVAFLVVRMRGLGMFTKMLSPFFLGCALVGLALTFVRSSYIGLFAAGFVGLVVAGAPKMRVNRLLAGVACVALLIVVLPKGHTETYYNGESTGNLVAQRALSITQPTKVGSMGVRFSAWESIFTTSFEMPIGRGLGVGAAGKFSGQHAIAAAGYSESQVFSILAELGWPGTFMFVWIVGYGFVLSLRVHDRLRSPDLRQVARICMMIQVGLTVVGLTGGVVLYTVPGSLYYWTVLGMVTVLPRLDDPAPAEEAA